MKARVRKIFGFVIAVSPLMVPALAAAQCMTSGGGGFVPLACTELGSKLSDIYGSQSLSTYVNRLFQFALSAGAIFAVVKIAQAGFIYMMAGDNETTIKKSKAILGDVALGLLLLLSVYLILYQINPNILNLDAFQGSLKG